MKRSIYVFLSLLVAVSFILTACKTATEAPTVEETEVVATEAPTEAAPTEMVYEDQPFGENLPTAPTIDTPFFQNTVQRTKLLLTHTS